MNTRLLFAFLAMFFAAQSYASEITVTDAWARETAPGQENGSVGLLITSQNDARLISVETTAAASAEIHTMTMDNGVMKMRQLENLPLPARQAVSLGPGGDHLMLFGIKQPLKAGGKVPLILTVQFADKRIEKIKINALVKPLTGAHEHQHH